MTDMAHIAGLVAAGEHPNPVPHSDFVTTTTHKTLRGPRGGLIICRTQFAKDLDRSLFPGVQGGPLMHVIAAKAVCLREALTPEFKTYQQQIVKNAVRLAAGLSKAGFRLVSGGTDNHLMLVDVFSRGLTGKVAEAALGRAGITVNKNAIPFDQHPPLVASGVRIGTPAVTTRGLKEADMDVVAGLIARVLSAPDDEGVARAVRDEVLAMCRKHPLYPELMAVRRPDMESLPRRSLGEGGPDAPLHDRVEAAFGRTGPLAAAFDGYEPRPGQQQLAGEVARTFASGGTLVAEAGTGTGKTLAYLVPAVLAGKRVLISTGTRTLQDQVFYKDLPALSRALGREIRAAYMKGRTNYLCRHRFGAVRAVEASLTARRANVARPHHRVGGGHRDGRPRRNRRPAGRPDVLERPDVHERAVPRPGMSGVSGLLHYADARSRRVG